MHGETVKFINTYISLMYELKKKLERYLRENLFGPGPRLIKKRIYRAAVWQRLRSTALEVLEIMQHAVFVLCSQSLATLSYH